MMLVIIIEAELRMILVIELSRLCIKDTAKRATIHLFVFASCHPFVNKKSSKRHHAPGDEWS